MDLAFLLMRFPLKWSELAFYFEKMIYFWENNLESPSINKIRKKTLSVTPYLEKVVCEKPNLGSGSGYLLKRYGENCSTPLSP